MPHKPELKRELGLPEITLSGLAVIMGAGIYVLVGKAAGLAGNAVWLSFVFSAVIALLTGLSYAELSSLFPQASAEYEYTRKAFGEVVAFTIGWLVIFSGIIAGAAVALGFGGYFGTLSDTGSLVSAWALIVALTLLVSYGIKESMWFLIVSTLIEAGALIFLVIISIPYLGRVDYFQMPNGFAGVIEATALIFFSYLGFEEIVKLAEEAREPRKTMPRALLLAIPLSTLLYVAVGIASVSVMGWQALGKSEAPLADVVFSVLRSDASFIMTVIALVATANTVLVTVLTTSRIVYGMGRSGSLPQFLGRVHGKRKTPWFATFCVGGASMLFVFLGDVGLVASVANFALFTTFIVINGSVVYLRYKEDRMERSFKVPFAIGKMPVLPVFGVLSCLFMLLQLPARILLAGVGLTLLGTLVGFVLRKAQKR